MDWKKIINNTVLVLQSMILFMLIFESFLEVPTFLQPLGRMHPLILHFPIVLIVLLFLLELGKNHIEEKSFQKLREITLYATVFTTSITALFGFFLAAEGGYSGNTLLIHKWTGVLLSFIVYGLIFVKSGEKTFTYALYSSVLLVIGAGHFGATLTHGEGFLLEPIMPKSTLIVNQNTPVYTAIIEPILDAKCTSCHNPSKKKGDLDMSSFELLMAGGKNGPILVHGDAKESSLMKRIVLPLEHDDHMPPDGKPQLTDQEFSLIKGWIEMSGDNVFTLASLSTNDTLYQFAQARIDALNNNDADKTYDFDYASASTIESLNNSYRTVKQPVATSPALDVSVFVRQAFIPEYLSELSKVDEQIVSLNLSYLPITDKDIEFIASFPNLEKLLLNYTDITGATLDKLSNCSNLKELSLAGTKVSTDISGALSSIKSLQIVRVWDTEITPDEAKEMQADFEIAIIDGGFDPRNAVPLKLSPPMIMNDERVLKKGTLVELTHKLPETKIYYTIDGSDPDSTSALYDKPLVVEEIDKLKAIAAKDNWETSTIFQTKFFIDGFTPKSVKLTKPADQKYKGSGSKTLIDKKKGTISAFSAPTWIGYQKNEFEAIADFGSNPPKINKIVIGYGVNMPSYIMEPVKVEVYGGSNPSTMKLIKRVNPRKPTMYEANREDGFTIEVNTNHQYYKVVAYPETNLPEWHQGKGEPGWVFIDELFFY